MPNAKRRTNEEIIVAYQATGSVWKAAKLLGLCGQSVWERLKTLGYSMPSQNWTPEEHEEFKELLSQCTLGEVAMRLGRTYASVASRASKEGLTKKYKGRQISKKHKSAMSDDEVRSAIETLRSGDIKVTPLSRMIGVDIEILVLYIQKTDMEFWKDYSQQYGSGKAICVYCGSEFYGMNKKQKTCTRKCGYDARADNGYFGGKRRQTVGLSEGICQVCGEKKERLSSHHVLGKDNDQDNECLIAVCNSCHQIVGILAAKSFVDDPAGWENLIQLVMARRMRQKNPEYAGIYACVEVEHLFADEVTVQ